MFHWKVKQCSFMNCITSKVSQLIMFGSTFKKTPICDDTKATVANNSARGHEDLMVPSALKPALVDLRCEVSKVGEKLGKQKSVSNVDIKLTEGH